MFAAVLLACLCFTPALGRTCPRRFNFEQLGTAANGPRWDTAIDGDFGDRRLDNLIDDATPITADKEIELGLRFADHRSTVYELRVVLVGAKQVYISMNGSATPKIPRPGHIEEWVFVYKFPSDITSFSFYTSPEEDDGYVSINGFDISGCITKTLGRTCPRGFNFEQLGTAANGPRWATAIDGDFGDRRLDNLIDDATPITADKEIELVLRFADHGSTVYELRVVLMGAKQVYISMNGSATPKIPRPGHIEEWVFVYKFPSDITSFSFYTSPEEDDGYVSINGFDISGCITKKKCPKPWSKISFNPFQDVNFLVTPSSGWDIVKGSKRNGIGVFTEDSVSFNITAKLGGYFDVFEFAVITKGVGEISIDDYLESINITGPGRHKTKVNKDRFMASEVRITFFKMDGAAEMKIRVMTFKMCALLNVTK